jgi:outer membrane efflux protein
MRGGVVALAGAIGLVAGCQAIDIAPPVRCAAPQLPAVPRSAIEPDVSALSATPAHGLPAQPSQYQRLTAAECRALAAVNAPLAAELDSHPANDAPAHPFTHKRGESADLSRQVRGYAADEIRNRSAAAALEDYYKLAAVEGQFDLAVAGHKVLTKQHSEAEKAIQQGLKDRGDVNALKRQMLEVESQAAKLDAAAGALNASLAGRLGLDSASPIWPADPLRIAAEEPDVLAAISTARQCRPDLNLLRALLTDADRGGELANNVLNGINPLLGNAAAIHPLFALLAAVKHDPTRLEAGTRRQLLGALESRERQAEAEVRAAVASLKGARASAAAKAAEVRNLVARVAELEKREAAGQQVTLELATARLDLLKVKGELVQAVADWHVADVKLRQAMGLLVRL